MTSAEKLEHKQMVAMLFVFVAAGPMFMFGSVRYSRKETNPNAQCRAAAQNNAQRTKENETLQHWKT